MPYALRRGSLLLLGLIAACSSDGSPPDGSMPGDDGAIPGRDGAAPVADGGGVPGTDGAVPGEDAGPLPPTITSACDRDGVCERADSETCASCGEDCGSCDVEDLPDRRAKYVDGSCDVAGDGLTDECATSAGGPGRFDDLQLALASLEAGDTLYVHPGDYFRDERTRDSGAIFTMDASGTPERPIVITARFRDRLPMIHSCDPADPTYCPSPALGIYGSDAIVDHLGVRGRVQVWGATRSVMQYLDCSHGWGACGDGNWSCLRIESCTDCSAHHNYVHDVSGAGMGEACLDGTTADFPDRGAGLKEFQSVGTIWELNTVIRTPHWGYDLHRNSENTTVRFNDFPAFPGSAIRVERTRGLAFYGNVMVARESGPGGCIDVGGRNERVMDEPHLVEVHHNTCIGANTGFEIVDELPSQVHDNVVQGLVDADGEPSRNVVVQSDESALGHNAYDATGNYRRQTYEPDTWSEDLASWQAAWSWDADSVEVDGGACEFVTAPSGDGAPYDVHVAGGACATLARDGGEVGAYGVTSCVGHLCD